MSGKLLRLAGPKQSLLVGQALQICEMVLTGLSTKGWHLYATRPLFGLGGYAGVLMSSMAYNATSIGAECGVSEGQLQVSRPMIALWRHERRCVLDLLIVSALALQASLMNLKTICLICAPLIWSPIYSFGAT